MSISVFDMGYGWRYTVRTENLSIVQDFAPALSGNISMTEQQALSLATLVETKLNNNLLSGVTETQVLDLWNGIRTISQIILDEQNGVA